VCDCVQNTARLITWRQIHKVLGMDKLSYKELFSRSRHSAPAAQTDADAGESADKQNNCETVAATDDRTYVSASFCVNLHSSKLIYWRTFVHTN